MVKIRLVLAVVLLSISSAQAEPRPADIVDLHSVDPTILVNMMYFGTVNFVGRRIDGYHADLCLLTNSAAQELHLAQSHLQAYGAKTGQVLSLEVRDCYRPKKAVAHFLAWVRRPDQLEMKPLFYPNLTKQEIIDQGYVAPISGHSRASTVDLTIARKNSKGDFEPLAMGTRIDFFGEISHTDYPGITVEEKANRGILKTVLGSRFKNFAGEWWHYSLVGEPYPKTYFDFNVEAP
jgi:D-alanyl-D-alanine dipeptidase